MKTIAYTRKNNRKLTCRRLLILRHSLGEEKGVCRVHSSEENMCEKHHTQDLEGLAGTVVT